MKQKILYLLLCFCPFLQAEIIQPIHWSDELIGDSVRLTATIDEGWYMQLLELGGASVDDDTEYRLSASFMVHASAPQVRAHACNDVTCLAPEEYVADIPSLTTQPSHFSQSGSFDSLWWIFVMGLLGGILAIFTPCVWPIIPMTVSFFMKRNGGSLREGKSGNRKQTIIDALTYGLSIIFIYVGLGLLITVLFGASALNALSTNAVVNLLFFALLVVFAASFFGAFELTLPASWSTAMSQRSQTSVGWLGIVFMAFTLVIVSFSCTGPIIGTLLVEAAGKSLLAPTIGMLGFAIALALPFTLFALFPSALSSLPKSGGWMNRFKVTLAFLELALSLKFFSVADLAYGWHLLDREVFIALWVVIFALLGLYLLGIIRFPADDDSHRTVSVTRLTMAIISLAFACYMLPGLWGAPLRAISAFAPPISTQDWTMSNGANYSSQEIYDDIDEALRVAQREQRPVFVDFNGYGCVNCRKMEAAVLHRPEVQQRLSRYVFVSLIVDNKRPLPEPIKVEENGREVTLRTIGDKWSHYQRTHYNANAQPFYVQLSPEGELIAEPGYGYDEDISKFLNWLKE